MKYITTQITIMISSSRIIPTPAMDASSNALGLRTPVTESVVVDVPWRTIYILSINLGF